MLILALWACPSLGAQATTTARWYRSDGAGIAYAAISEAASRRERGWTVRIQKVDEPVEGVKAASVEERTLFEGGVERRRTLTAFASSGATLYVETKEEDGRRRIERYDTQRRLVEERNLGPDGSGEAIEYRWAASHLVSASSYAVGPDGALSGAATWTDTYRYLRSGELRSVTREPAGVLFLQRTFRAVPSSMETRSADGSTVRTTFDPLGRVATTTRTEPGDVEGAVETVAYGEKTKKGGPSVTRRVEGTTTVETERNAAGRVVRETRYAPDKTVLEESFTEWSGDRIASVRTRSGREERRVVYSYDPEGRRIAEKDFRNGVLERAVRMDGGSEVEELYRNGGVVLRSYYQDGALVKEERVR